MIGSVRTPGTRTRQQHASAEELPRPKLFERMVLGQYSDKQDIFADDIRRDDNLSALAYKAVRLLGDTGIDPALSDMAHVVATGNPLTLGQQVKAISTLRRARWRKRPARRRGKAAGGAR